MMTVSKSASKIIDRDVKCQLVFAISITGEGGKNKKKRNKPTKLPTRITKLLVPFPDFTAGTRLFKVFLQFPKLSLFLMFPALSVRNKDSPFSVWRDEGGKGLVYYERNQEHSSFLVIFISVLTHTVGESGSPRANLSA